MKKILLSLLLFFTAICAGAQGVGSITGKITTPDNKPAPFATLSIKGTMLNSATDSLGYYTIAQIPGGKYVLTVSGIGFYPTNKQFVVVAGVSQTVNVTIRSKSNELDEVTVSGNKPVVTSSSEYVSKMPLSSIENAQVYTGISNALIVQQKIFTLEDAVKNVPGISIASGSGFQNTIDYGGTSFSSRGFQTKIRALNGLANNMASSADVANLEKIEVIKGPSATLFGNIISSYGGLINRVTKKPYDYTGGSVEYAGGSYGFHRLAVDVNSPLNEEKTFLSRLNVAVQNRNTFQDNGAFSKSVFVAPSFSYKLSDRIKINLNAEINRSEDGGQGGGILFSLSPSYIKGYLPGVLKGFGVPDATAAAIIASAPTTIKQTFGSNNIKDFNLDPYRSYTSNDLTTKMSSLNMNAEVHYKISDQWNSVTSMIFGSGNSDGFNTYLILVPNEVPALVASLPTGRVTFGTAGADYFTRNGRKSNASLETQQIQQNFIGDFKIGALRNRMVVGLDYYHLKTTSIYRNFMGSLFGIPLDNMFDQVKVSGNAPNYYNFNAVRLDDALQKNPVTETNFGNNQSVYSSYVNDVLNITDQIIASAGIRIDRFQNKGTYDGITDTYKGNYNQTAFSPKFGLIYQPVKDKVSFFGNYQTSFTNQEGTSFDGTAFKPEQAMQWEAGVKTSFFDGHFTSSVSYYDIKVDDKVRVDYAHPLFSVQDGTQVSRGIEAEILGNPIPELNILLGYAYNDSKMTKADALIEGLRPAGSGPKHQFNFWIHYHFNETTPLNGFSIGTGGNYVGETLAVNLNPDGAIIIPSYKVFNAKLSYDKAKYSFGLRVNNLNNERYWVGLGSVSPMMPRQYVGTIGLKF
ncbi:TonB-dependent receptor [Pedobacter duraquae]|uniref:Iron complex outermembrane receptor protein n=1 Tax=Pedobacter duraquae TaxID=425511 RepID=A0A4R6IEM3_9SPHI|nr:TonB-dependent receptor [Pedobacter duraquae]TDO20753.1 iron complex outermembrane receptor protein [Pedobacter duraquae]